MLMKVIRFKLPQLGAKMLIKIPRVGMQLMIKYPTYARLPPPLWGLTLIGALFKSEIALQLNNNLQSYFYYILQ
jgi:hypothetical protein